MEVHDFGRSWRSGLAFLAMIKSINTALVDLRASLSREPRENIKLAFMVAHHNLDIPPLLEPEGKSLLNRKCLTFIYLYPLRQISFFIVSTTLSMCLEPIMV